MRNENIVKRLTLWTFVLGVTISLVLIGPMMSTTASLAIQTGKESIVSVNTGDKLTTSLSTKQDNHKMDLSFQQEKTRKPSTITFGNITITTNATQYYPGETLKLSMVGPSNELAGTMEWKLLSPLNESIFGFDLLRFLLLNNFDFATTDTSEWTNDPTNPFDNITISNGHLNLTELADADTNPARVYINKTGVNLTAITINFNYLGLTPNLVKNASFESVTAWTFNNSLVKQSNALVHGGSFSLFANKTPSNSVVASQNVTVPANKTLIISAWGTGINANSHWLFRITAYNATGHPLGTPKNSTRSTSLNEKDLENEFGMLETTFFTPPKTSYVQIELIGINSTENGTYTGYFDDVTISIEPTTALELQYYNGTNWVNVTGFKKNTHKWNTFQTTINLNATAPAANGTIFALVLPDQSNDTTDPPTFWLLDNFTFVKITPPIGRLTAAGTDKVVTGSVNATRIFRVDDQVKNETLFSFYEYTVKQEEKTIVSVNVTLTLPKEHVYYGPHALDIIFYPEATSSETPKPRVFSSLIYIIDDFRFEPLSYYALRGSIDFSYNDTQTNETISIQQVYYEDETSQRLFSPGDNVTIIGFIIPESQKRLFNRTVALDTSFYKIENGHARFKWQGLTENITWGTNGDSILRVFSTNAKDIAHGNFSVAYPQLTNYTKFVAINFVIPRRGIFGSVNSTLFFNFQHSLNNQGHNFTESTAIQPYTVNMSLPQLEIKFRLNITQSLLPSTTRFVPLQSIDGTFSIDPLHARDDLLNRYGTANVTLANGTKITLNRTMFENITNYVPLADLHFKMFLDRSDKGNISSFDDGIDIPISIERFGDKFSWFYKFSPNDLNGTYVARITWLEAEKVNDTASIFIPFNKKGSTPTELTIDFIVDLQFVPFYDVPISLTHGEILTLNFTLTISELGSNFYIPGVKLSARLDDNESLDIPIIENNGVYTIIIGTRSLPVGTHSINIVLQSNGKVLRNIQFTITPNPSLTNPTDPFTPPEGEDSATTLISTVIVGLATIIALGLIAFIPRYAAHRRKR